MFSPRLEVAALAKVIGVVLLLAVGVRGQVLERLVSLQDAAAGSFPSGMLLLASDGNLDGTTEGGKLNTVSILEWATLALSGGHLTHRA